MKSPQIQFPLSRLSDIQGRPVDFRLLERIPLTGGIHSWPLELSPSVGDEQPIILLDTETTGLSSEEDAIIELGLVKVLYSPSTKRITSILNVMSLYEDPRRPIPQFITELTGINDQMVSGQVIDNTLVYSWFDENPLIVAHNAAFDRPFFENRFPELKGLSWACSANGISWRALGFESIKLEYILMRLGWFYEGHRAATDCLAMAWLLHSIPEAFELLLTGAENSTVVIRAFNAPFEVKDHLKRRGYRWHDGAKTYPKHWWREVTEDDLPLEKSYLDDLYEFGSDTAQYEFIDASKRFKAQ